MTRKDSDETGESRVTSRRSSYRKMLWMFSSKLSLISLLPNLSNVKKSKKKKVCHWVVVRIK